MLCKNAVFDHWLYLGYEFNGNELGNEREKVVTFSFSL